LVAYFCPHPGWPARVRQPLVARLGVTGTWKQVCRTVGTGVE
jgi:hypothetical protein